jgi:LacI family transcriptional regulator
MQQLLKRNPRPGGVFCFNDPVAVGAMRAILEAGLTIPGDIALIGVANMHFSDLLTVPLSTVDQDTAAIGKLAAERLLECMKGGDSKAEPVLVAPRLVVRDSSRRRPA